MKVEKIYYQANFPLQKFIFENIGVTVIVEKGDDAKEVLKAAKRWCESEHIRLHPELYPKKSVVNIPDEVANGQDVDNVLPRMPSIAEILEEGLPVIQTNRKGKARPTIVELKKFENAIKGGDEKALEELERNYQFNTPKKV